MRRCLLLLIASAACGTGQPDDPSILNARARSADGIEIEYDARGRGQPAIVLVHGWTNDRSIWGEHVHTLADTHQVVALDLAGHGGSGAGRTEWTMDAFGEDVVAVADDLGLDQVVLVGFSMGGAIVLEAADRMPGRVVGVVFIDTFHDPDRAVTHAEAAELEAAMRENWGDTAFLRAFAFAPDAPDSLVQQLQNRMPPQPREYYFAMLPEFVEWVQTQFKPTLQGTVAPVAAINTLQQPTNVESIRRYAPSFTLDTIAGVGHAGILQRRVEDFDERLLAIVRRFLEAPARDAGDP
jgi:pimeloyl-ACP methyl ester carboxylesterase